MVLSHPVDERQVYDIVSGRNGLGKIVYGTGSSSLYIYVNLRIPAPLIAQGEGNFEFGHQVVHIQGNGSDRGLDAISEDGGHQEIVLLIGTGLLIGIGREIGNGPGGIYSQEIVGVREVLPLHQVLGFPQLGFTVIGIFLAVNPGICRDGGIISRPDIERKLVTIYEGSDSSVGDRLGDTVHRGTHANLSSSPAGIPLARFLVTGNGQDGKR